MFCNRFSEESKKTRSLKKWIYHHQKSEPFSIIILILMMKKEDYNFDENGNCILLNGTAVSWEQVKNEGMDAVSLYYKSKNGKWIKFADDEMD
ncbi:MAG: hypothetical protein K2G83_00065 [Ruminococcus sp.]|nr:hypothetical protein [Ruminococcus sp.]